VPAGNALPARRRLHQLCTAHQAGPDAGRRQRLAAAGEATARRLTGSSAGAPVPGPGTQSPPGSAQPAGIPHRACSRGVHRQMETAGAAAAACATRPPTCISSCAQVPGLFGLAARQCSRVPPASPHFLQSGGEGRAGGSMVIARRRRPGGPFEIIIETVIPLDCADSRYATSSSRRSTLQLAFCSAPAALPTARACSRRAT
jgi:hypothetical protein